MPPTPFLVTVDPYSQTAVVSLTGATFYSTQDGSSTVTFPETISTATTYYTDAGSRFADNVRVTASIKIGGDETAGALGTTRTYSIARGRTTIVPDFVGNVGAAHDLEALYDNGNSGTAITINPANGARQKVTLTGANSYVDVTLTSPAQTYELTVFYYQDGTGNRAINHATAVAYENNAWPNLVQTANGLAAKVSYLWDGTSWTVSSPTATLPGVDPSTLPGCIIAWEAVAQPLAVAGVISRINNRASASNSPSSGFNNSPTITEPITTGVRPLTLPGVGRRFFDFTATNKSMDGFTMSTAISANGTFTIVGSTRITSTAAADGTGLLSFTKADGTNFGLSINGNGNDVFVNVANTYSNFTAPAGTLTATPHVFTLAQNGAVNGVFRADSTVKSDSTWRLQHQVDKVYFNASLAGMTNQTNCLQQAALYVFAAAYLPADVLTGVERWAGHLAGVSGY